MLNLHLIPPQYSKQHNAQYLHYLGLGSFNSPFQCNSISAFSIVILHSNQSLPQITNNKQRKYVTFLFLLRGRLKINGKEVVSSLEQNNIVMNPINIANESQQSSTFAYIVFNNLQKDRDYSKSLKITKVSQNKTQIPITRQLIYLIQGNISFEVGGNQAVWKKEQKQGGQSYPLLYCPGQMTITSDPESFLLRINDNV